MSSLPLLALHEELSALERRAHEMLVDAVGAEQAEWWWDRANTEMGFNRLPIDRNHITEYLSFAKMVRRAEETEIAALQAEARKRQLPAGTVVLAAIIPFEGATR